MLTFHLNSEEASLKGNLHDFSVDYGVRKKVWDCYILHTVLLAIILVLIITITCYHYAKQKSII